MTEQKVGKRGWVKNAAIIFLAVLLVLTFFSNTWMNRSLPEVAAQYVVSGTISAQIRGTGTVTAAENFEVKTSQSRTVLSVPVKVGDQVSIGDTLVLFSDAESEDLKLAQDALDDMVLAYQKALINASSGQYSMERRAVQDAQDALDAAKKKRDANYVADGDLTAAQKAVDSAQLSYDVAELAKEKAQNDLDALGGKQEGSYGDYSAVTVAKNKLDALKLLYDKELYSTSEYENNVKGFYPTVEQLRGTTSAAVYSEYLALKYSAYENGTDAEKTQYGQYLAYTEVKDAQAAYDAALKAYNESSTGGNVYEYNRLNNILTSAKNTLSAADKTLKSAQDALKKTEDKKEAYDTAIAEVTANQKSLQEALFTLEKAVALESLDFDDMRKSIDEQNKALESLKSGGEGSVVTSQVNGIVASVNVSAGNTASPDTALMVVEVPDMGYTVSFSVTKEQSQKVRQGDVASVTSRYWGSNLSANLAGIRTDPENPGTHKMLVFKITGDVESGEQLTISIGERGANYDAIVPNSALRTDSNGTFVLLVVAKSSALGNRYTASRVDVQVLASDDVSSAVSGGLATNDFVITTSSAPIEPGMLVRLPDNT